MEQSDQSFDAIMESIVSGLTGEWAHDSKYLRSRMDAHKHHPLSREILRECGRIFWDSAPEELRQGLCQVIGNHGNAAASTLDEVSYCQKLGNHSKALQLIEPLVRRYDQLVKSGWNSDDSQTRYFDFRSPADEALWRNHNDEPRDIRPATEPFSNVYYSYGCCLMDTGRVDEAIVAFEKAIRWNPVDMSFRFELAECFRLLQDMESYQLVLQELATYLSTSDELERYHRVMHNLGAPYGEVPQSTPHPNKCAVSTSFPFVHR